MSLLVWSQPALDDLRRIRAFLEPRDPDAAASVIEAILNRVDQLARFPLSGASVELADFRKLSVSGYPYVIVYRSDAAGVAILRVHHAAQDWRPS